MLGELEANGTTVLCDLEAGIGTVLRLLPGQVDLILVVADPSAKAIEVAARSVRIAASRADVLVIANKVRDETDVETIRAAVGNDDVFAVPEDPAIEQADREGVAPIDLDASAPAVRALVSLAERLASGSRRS